MAEITSQEMLEMLNDFLYKSRIKLEDRIFAVEMDYQIPEIEDSLIKVYKNKSSIIYLVIEDGITAPSGVWELKVNDIEYQLVDRENLTFDYLAKGYYNLIEDSGKYIVKDYSENNNPILIGTALESEVLEGKTFYKDSLASLKTGLIENNGQIQIEPKDTIQIVLDGFYEKITIKSYSFTELIGTAMAEHVRGGVSFYGSSPDLKIGLMTNRGSLTIEFNEDEQIFLEGIYSSINVNPPGDIPLNGTAVPENVRNGKTFYKDSPFNKQTGTMYEEAAQSIGGSINTEVTKPRGYYKQITVGSYQSPTLTGDAQASKVKAGKTFYSNSYDIKTGTMETKSLIAGVLKGLITNGFTFSIETGYYTPTSDIKISEPNLQPHYILKDHEMLGILGTFDSGAQAVEIDGSIVKNLMAGENLTAGDTVYTLDVSGTIKVFKCSNSLMTNAIEYGIVEVSALSGNMVDFTSLFRN